jgi:hypothetical protein
MATANSTSTPSSQLTSRHASNFEERIGALREESEVLAAAVERMEQSASASTGSTINPLVCDHYEDTLLGVSEVLAFLSGAMVHAEQSIERPAIPLNGGCTGLSRILDTCRAALNCHLPKEGAV